MKGFTLVELLVAIAITAILVGVSLNVYVVIYHGFAESTIRYGRFVGENVHELRCRTRFVRGLPPCDDAPRTFHDSRSFRDNVRERF